MTYGPKLMLVSDADLAAEIRDSRKEIENLRAWIEIDRAPSDRDRLNWLEANYAELQREADRRQKRPVAAASSSAAKGSVTSNRGSLRGSATENGRSAGDDFEGPPFITVENGVPRLWRPGDRIHRKKSKR